MKYYDYKDPLISIHIPKSGGTSFSNVLKEWFGQCYYQHYFDEKRNKLPKKVRLKVPIFNIQRRSICIHGHFNRERGFGINKYYPKVNQFISILRDPLELQLSFFFYKEKILSNNSFYQNGDRVTEFFKDVDEFLECSKPFMLLHFPDKIDESNYMQIINEQFVHLGIMENYQRSIDIIAEKLKKSRVKVDHLNKSPRNQNPSESSKKIFLQKCSLEYKIYNYAVSLNS